LYLTIRHSVETTNNEDLLSRSASYWHHTNTMETTLRTPELASIIFDYLDDPYLFCLRPVCKSLYSYSDPYYRFYVMETLLTLTFNDRTNITRVVPPPHIQCHGLRKNGEQCRLPGHIFGDLYPQPRYCKRHSPI